MYNPPPPPHPPTVAKTIKWLTNCCFPPHNSYRSNFVISQMKVQRKTTEDCYYSHFVKLIIKQNFILRKIVLSGFWLSFLVWSTFSYEETVSVFQNILSWKVFHCRNCCWVISSIGFDGCLCCVFRDKAALWQQTDALAYEHKRKSEGKWLDNSSVTKCMGCSADFSLFLRKVGSQPL